MAVELELKYSSPLERTPTLGELETALLPLHVGVTDEGSAQHSDLYYDSGDRALERAGFALRVREGENERTLTLKSRGSAVRGLHERLELDFLVDDGAPPPWPPELLLRLGGAAPGIEPGGFAPRLLITTHRHRFTLSGAEAAFELSFDQVSCRPAPGLGGEYEISEALFNEVEIEALPGAALAAAEVRAALREIGGALGNLVPLYASDVSKLERAAALLAPFELGGQ